jgi:hypothetical protein
MLNGTTIAKWNYQWSSPGRSNFDLDPGTGGNQNFAPNASSNNGTKSTPALSADILGDWREEVIWRRSDNTALMIFSTIIPATSRLTTLMHDSQYRSAVAWQNSGYNQPPHPSFFLGAGMTTPPQPNIYLASSNPAIPGDFDLDGTVDAVDLGIWQQLYGTSQVQGYLPGDADGDGYVGGRDFLIWQRNHGQSQSPPLAMGQLLDNEPELALLKDSAFENLPAMALPASSLTADYSLLANDVVLEDSVRELRWPELASRRPVQSSLTTAERLTADAASPLSASASNARQDHEFDAVLASFDEDQIDSGIR